MTLGIGIQCPEGIVLASDSLMAEARRGSDVINTVVVGGRKGVRHWPPATPSSPGMAFIVSGLLPVALIDSFSRPLESDTFEEAVDRLFGQLVALQTDVLSKILGGLGERRVDLVGPDAPQLLVAGGPGSLPPEMGCLMPSGQQWSRGQSCIYAVGGWIYQFVQPRNLLNHPVPATLGECVDLAVTWARQHIAEVYQGKTLQALVDSGWIPYVGFPLDVVTLTADGIKREVFYK